MKFTSIIALVVSLVAAQQAPAAKGAKDLNTLDYAVSKVNEFEDMYSAENIISGKALQGAPINPKVAEAVGEIYELMGPVFNKAVATIQGVDADDKASQDLARAYASITKNHANDITQAFGIIKAEMHRDPHYASNIRALANKGDSYIGGAIVDSTGAVIKEMLKNDPESTKAFFNGLSEIQDEFTLVKPETFGKYAALFSTPVADA